jgi:hypothetical protein
LEPKSNIQFYEAATRTGPLGLTKKQVKFTELCVATDDPVYALIEAGYVPVYAHDGSGRIDRTRTGRRAQQYLVNPKIKSYRRLLQGKEQEPLDKKPVTNKDYFPIDKNQYSTVGITQKLQDPDHYIYLIMCGKFTTMNDCLIKIGMTKDVQRRRKDLQASNPHTLLVVGLSQPCSPKLARYVEQLLHLHYAKCLERGEWFSLPVEQVKWLTNKVLNQHITKTVQMLTKMEPYNSMYSKVYDYLLTS